MSGRRAAAERDAVDTAEAYEAKRDALVRQLAEINAVRDGTGNGVGDGVRLEKTHSNLFRTRQPTGVRKLDVRSLDQVISVDRAGGTAVVEGMTTYEDLADETLRFGLLPTVVPELATITIGGAVSGGGIEASSFRYGLVHETIVQMEVLLSDGRVVTARPHDEFADLFFGLPNSFGTLGYILKLTVKLMEAKPYVHLRHRRFARPTRYFEAISGVVETGQFENEAVDFMDGMAESGQLYLTVGRFVDVAPYTSDYSFRRIYYRSIQTRNEDYLSARDFIWRWDPDWFWCSKRFGLQNPVLRLLVGKWLLGSKAYWRLAKIERRLKLAQKVEPLRNRGAVTETVIQDAQIPIDRAEEFLAFFTREIGINPVWICPTRAVDPHSRYPLYPLDPSATYVNFGFWDSVPTTPSRDPNHFNRLLEREVTRLGGRKGLYSHSFYSRDEFWELYDRTAYEALKEKYDPEGRFKDLYAKCVQGA
jgi:FAD/FMN-containing dehydrogenase